MKTVLVVEDEDAVRELVCTILKSAGISVVSAEDGIQALRLIRERSFDLVLLDLRLPGMNGLELLDQLRHDVSPPKVIIMTGDDAPETVLTAARRQAYRYLLKPFEKSVLLALVNSALAAGPISAPIEVVSARPEWVELLVPCDLESADRISSFMESLKSDVPTPVREAVGRAFRELLLNAIEWGGNFDSNRKVRISYLRARRMILYRIADPGSGFQMHNLPHAAVSNPEGKPLNHMEVRTVKGLRPGGFGLLVVKSIVDELIYNEAQNEVVFVKYLD